MKGTLQEHLDVLGHTPHDLAFGAKVNDAVVRRAIAGQPITEQHASQIKKYVGQKFGHPHNAKDDYQIDGLQSV